MGSALALKLYCYRRNGFRTHYTQGDHSTNLVEICEGALRLVELYPEGHINGGYDLSFDGFREHLDIREDDSASSSCDWKVGERA